MSLEKPSVRTASVPAKRRSKILPAAIVLAIIIVGAVAVQLTTGSLIRVDAAVKKSASAGTKAQSQDIVDLIAKVGRHITINTKETPTVGTVQDAAMLRSQNLSFYGDAQNGDRLLIWSDKAVLYSPSRDLILSVVPINLTAAAAQIQNQQASVTSTKAEAPVVGVLNGSSAVGLGKTLVAKLKNAGFNTLSASDALHKDYATTTIFVASQKPFPQSVKRLVDLTHGKVVSSLSNEAAANADIVVIIGKDYQP